MKNLLALAFLAVVALGCAHVDAVANDIKSCITAQDKQILADAEKTLVPFVEDVIMCEAADQSVSELPACALQGLDGACAALGPDAERFKQCVVNTIEADPLAAPLPKTRAGKLKTKLRARAGQSS